MQELDIQIICANTPKPKDALSAPTRPSGSAGQEMRLRGISSLEAGNAYLPEFMADFNQRFGIQTHTASMTLIAPSLPDNLTHILTWQEPRILSKN